MTHQHGTTGTSVTTRLFRLGGAVALSFILAIALLFVPIAFQTGTLTSIPGLASLDINLDGGLGTVYAAGGLTITKKARSDLNSTVADPGTFVGQQGTITYTLIATNNTGSSLNVRVFDPLPNDVVCVEDSVATDGSGWTVTGDNACNTDGGASWDSPGAVFANNQTVVLTWTVELTRILPGGTQIINGGYIITDELGSLDDAGPPYTVTVVGAELVITKTVAPSPTVDVDGTLLYTLTVANVGPLTATGVLVTDTLPVSTTFDAATGGVSPASGVINFTTFDLGPAGAVNDSQSVTFTVDLTPGLAAGDTIVNRTYGASATNVHPSDFATPTQAVTVTVDAAITLTVDKLDSPEPAVAGEPLTYTIIITNGPGSTGSVRNLVVTDTLPAEFVLTGDPTFNPGTVDDDVISDTNIAGQTVLTMTPGAALGTGEVLTITMSGYITSPLPDADGLLVITNTYGVTGPVVNVITNPLGIDATRFETTTVESRVVIDVNKTVVPEPSTPPEFVTPGEVVTYTITLTNSGSRDSGNILVTDLLTDVINSWANVTPFDINYVTQITAGETVSIPFRAIVGTVDSTITLAIASSANGAWTTSPAAFNAGGNTEPAGTLTYASVDASSCKLTYLSADLEFTNDTAPNNVKLDIEIDGQPVQTIRESLTDTLAVDISDLATALTEIAFSVSGAGTGDSPQATINAVNVYCINPAAVDQETYTASEYKNTVVTATYVVTDNISTNSVVTNTAPIYIAASTITMTKVATYSPVLGGAADVTDGATVTYTYIITNTGNRALTSLELVDDQLGIFSGTNAAVFSPAVSSTQALQPGNATTAIVTTTVTSLADQPDVLTLTNVATATGVASTTINSANVLLTSEATATASIPLTATTSITVSKSAAVVDGTFPAGVGDTIEYTIIITNQGPSPISVTDVVDVNSQGVVTDDLLTLPIIVQPDTPQSFTYTLPVDQAVINAAGGQGYLLTNTVTVTATDPRFGTAVETATETVELTATASLTIVKSVDPVDPVTIGDTITYTYTITNNGSVTVTNLSPSGIVDDKLGVITGSSLTFPLGPGLDTSVTTQTIVTQDLISDTYGNTNAYILTNIAVITGSSDLGPTEPATATASIPLTFTANVNFSKSYTTSAPEPLNVGDQITYTFRITNTGNVTFTQITLNDTFQNSSRGTVPISPTQAITLAPQPGISVTEVITVITINATDIEEAAGDGFLDNEATLTIGIPDLGVTPLVRTDVASVELDSSLTISITKTAVPTNNIRPGDEVTYTYRITNNTGGSVYLLDDWLVDDQIDLAGSGVDYNDVSPLVNGDNTVVVKTVEITYSDLDPSLQITNVVTVTGNTSSLGGGLPVVSTATATINLTYTQEITISKDYQAINNPVNVGDTITFTYRITNTGDVTVTLGALDDTLDRPGLLASLTLFPSVPTPTLGPDQAATTQLTYTVKFEEVFAGTLLTNTVTAIATDTVVAAGATVSADALVTVPITSANTIEVAKEVDNLTPNIGDTITFTITITNLTDVDASVTLSDPALPSFGSDKILSVNANDSWTAPFTYVVQPADVDGFTNTVTATGNLVISGSPPPLAPFDPVTATASIFPAFTPTITLDKITAVATDTQSAAPGDTVSYQFRVFNTSQVPVEVEIADLNFNLTYGPATLNVNDSVAYPAGSGAFYDYTLQESDFTFDPGLGQYIFTNTAVATATALGRESYVRDVFTVTLDAQSDIVVTKTANVDLAGDGQSVEYTFDYKNTSTLDFDNVTLFDPLVHLAPVSIGSLASGVTGTTTAAHTVTTAEADVGQLVNTVYITGTATLPIGGGSSVVTDTDTLTITTRRLLSSVALTTTPPVDNIPVNTAQPFTATINPDIAAVQPVSYTWNFGDGSTNTSTTGTISHTFSATGTYTVIVTASNGVSLVTDTLVVVVTGSTPPPPTTTGDIFLPIIMKAFTSAPDLVVSSVEAGSNGVKVVITNQGNGVAAPRSDINGITGWWVDFYLGGTDPNSVVNNVWSQGLAPTGVAWFVSNVTLAPNESLELTCTVPGAGQTCTGQYVVPSFNNDVTTNYGSNGVANGSSTIRAFVDSACIECAAVDGGGASNRGAVVELVENNNTTTGSGSSTITLSTDAVEFEGAATSTAGAPGRP